MTNILILGNGSREHAIAEKLNESKFVSKIFIENNSILLDKVNFINLELSSFCKIKDLCLNNDIKLVVIGPEKYLVDGIVDYLNSFNIKCFGPNKLCAKIEGSKYYSKSLMKKLNIPTTNFKYFTNADRAIGYIKNIDISKCVIKKSGLAGGKGVFLPNNNEEAINILNKIYTEEQNCEIIIEDRLFGEEVSLLAFCNGHNLDLMPQAKDFKRIYDDDKGNNTGGMGAICPVNILSSKELLDIKSKLEKIVKLLKYKGVLYVGIMKTCDSWSILEFNCRFGDPEAQVILNLLDSDFYKIIVDCIEENELTINWKKEYVANVVSSHIYYPFKKNTELLEININKKLDDNINIYWGNTKKIDKKIYTNGGRVCSVVGKSNISLYYSLKQIYNNIHKIEYEGQYYRRDIGSKYINSNWFKAEKKIKLAIIGSTKGTSTQLLLEKIKNKELNASVEVIISNKKNALILEKAKNYFIPYTYLPKKKYMSMEDYDLKLSRLLRVYDVDVVLLVGYMRIVSSVLINEYRNRIFNIHPSLLPKFAGGMDLNVHKEVLESGEIYSGCTIHDVIEKVDEGKIIIQKQIVIDNDETPESLKTRVQNVEQKALVEIVNLFSNNQILLWSSYTDSGVDIDKGNQFVSLIKNFSNNCNKNIGGFCSLFDFNDQYIGLSCDGVGTKLELAKKYNNYTTIGIDLVAMCVNDLICHGVKPMYFLDYFAVDSLNINRDIKIVEGIKLGCDIAGCELVGGETAELKNVYNINGFDLAGFAIGKCKKSSKLPRNIVIGSKIYGIRSSGLHSNGFSLVRKILRHYEGDIEKLLTPTRIYLEVLDLLEYHKENIQGLAHITGGGFDDNIRRIIPDNLTYEITNPFDLPEIFKWIMEKGNITECEMKRTFNCGIGMVVITDSKISLCNDFIYLGNIVKKKDT